MTGKSQGYQLPRKPGWLGGAYWGGLLAASLILLCSSIWITQREAAYFGYQPLLGTPLFLLRQVPYYQPFGWLEWASRFCMHPSPDVHTPVLRFASYGAASSALSLLLVYILNYARGRKFSQGTEDLYGSAKWAEKDDIKAAGLLNGKGVYVGGWYDKKRKRLNYLTDDSSQHVICLAPSRSGKGLSIIIPTLLAWQESAMVLDIKGENYAKTAGYRKSLGHRVLKFDPLDPTHSHAFNPLEEIRVATEFEVADSQNIAYILTHTEQESHADPHWADTAQSLMQGLILHILYVARERGHKPTLTDVGKLLKAPGVAVRDTLKTLMRYPHASVEDARRFGWKRDVDGELTRTHPTVAEQIQEALNKEEKEFKSVISSTIKTLAIFADPLVQRVTCRSDFRVRDLVDSEVPVSLYLIIPPSDSDRLRPLFRLFLDSFVKRLTQRMEFGKAENQQLRNKWRLLLMLDEFPSLRKMEGFVEALAWMAGYGIKAFIVAQDLTQIYDQYGQYQSILSNCAIRIAFTPNTKETAELLSELIGKTTIVKASMNYYGSRTSIMLGHVNTSLDQVARPLLTPDEVLRLPAPRRKGTGEGERIVFPGDMLVFTTGQPVIYGRQMLYTRDKELTRRSRIPAPTIEARPIAPTPQEAPAPATSQEPTPKIPSSQLDNPFLPQFEQGVRD